MVLVPASMEGLVEWTSDLDRPDSRTNNHMRLLVFLTEDPLDFIER